MVRTRKPGVVSWNLERGARKVAIPNIRNRVGKGLMMREVQRDHWEGSKPPRVTPRSCADRTSDRGQVGRSATQRRAGENPRFRSSRNPLDSILVLDISGRVPDPGTMLGGRELLHKQILIYYIVLTRRKQLKSHLDTPHAHGWEVKYITIHAST